MAQGVFKRPGKHESCIKGNILSQKEQHLDVEHKRLLHINKCRLHGAAAKK